MSNDLEKWRLMEKVKIAKYRHRGNELKIFEELKDYDPVLVKKVLDRLKKKQDYDTNHLISATLCALVLEGFDTLDYEYNMMLRSLDGKHEVAVSLCCRSVVDAVEEDGRKILQCWKCKKETRVKILTEAEVYELKLKILAGIKTNYDTIIEFAKAHNPPQQQGNVFNYKDARQFLVAGAKVEAIEKMDPYDRESLRLELERDIQGVSENDKAIPKKEEEGRAYRPIDGSAAKAPPTAGS